MKRRKLLALLLASAMAMSMAACGNDTPSESSTPSSPESSETPSSDDSSEDAPPADENEEPQALPLRIRLY